MERAVGGVQGHLGVVREGRQPPVVELVVADAARPVAGRDLVLARELDRVPERVPGCPADQAAAVLVDVARVLLLGNTA